MNPSKNLNSTPAYNSRAFKGEAPNHENLTPEYQNGERQPEQHYSKGLPNLRAMMNNKNPLGDNSSKMNINLDFLVKTPKEEEVPAKEEDIKQEVKEVPVKEDQLKPKEEITNLLDKVIDPNQENSPSNDDEEDNFIYSFDSDYISSILNSMKLSSKRIVEFNKKDCLAGTLIPKSSLVDEDALNKALDMINCFLTTPEEEKDFFKDKLPIEIFDHLLCLLPLAEYKPNVCYFMEIFLRNCEEKEIISLYGDTNKMEILKEIKPKLYSVEEDSEGKTKLTNYLTGVFSEFMDRLNEIFPFAQEIGS